MMMISKMVIFVATSVDWYSIVAIIRIDLCEMVKYEAQAINVSLRLYFGACE